MKTFLSKIETIQGEKWNGDQRATHSDLILWLDNQTHYKYDFVKFEAGDAEGEGTVGLFVYGPEAFNSVTLGPGHWLVLRHGYRLRMFTDEAVEAFIASGAMVDYILSVLETACILADPAATEQLRESVAELEAGPVVQTLPDQQKWIPEDRALASVLFRLKSLNPELALEVEKVFTTGV